ncbi:DNA-binding protein [Methanolobus sp. WCC5]|uniref:DNA-binding protein n=1 Tax=Methanolobus sp. WCC5 TaxID=3125785 RepID=UPI00324A5708
MLDYVSSKAIEEKWGITVRAVQLMCVQGKINGAKRLDNGKVWLIPADAERPVDYMRKNKRDTE